MHNTLKAETTPVIRQLSQANIRCVMVTGDHLLTAINVARDCEMLPLNAKVILVTAKPPVGNSPVCVKYSLAETCRLRIEDDEIVDHDSQDDDDREDAANDSAEASPWLTESWPESIFRPLEDMNRMWRRQVRIDSESRSRPARAHFALCGKTLDVIRKHCPADLLARILCRSTVLARMTPDQKTRLVEELQSLGFVVGMVGDGANDCGALKVNKSNQSTLK